MRVGQQTRLPRKASHELRCASYAMVPTAEVDCVSSTCWQRIQQPDSFPFKTYEMQCSHVLRIGSGFRRSAPQSWMLTGMTRMTTTGLALCWLPAQLQIGTRSPARQPLLHLASRQSNADETHQGCRYELILLLVAAQLEVENTAAYHAINIILGALLQ